MCSLCFFSFCIEHLCERKVLYNVSVVVCLTEKYVPISWVKSSPTCWVLENVSKKCPTWLHVAVVEKTPEANSAFIHIRFSENMSWIKRRSNLSDRQFSYWLDYAIRIFLFFKLKEIEVLRRTCLRMNVYSSVAFLTLKP